LKETARIMMERVKETYRLLGYSQEKDFPDEYYLMWDPQTLQFVRIYYNGKIWEYSKMGRVMTNEEKKSLSERLIEGKEG
jgi:hypothetical protein